MKFETRQNYEKLILNYKFLNLKEGDIIEILRENHPIFKKGERLIVLKSYTESCKWKFLNLATNVEFGFRLISLKYPNLYNENYGWKKVMKKRIYKELLFGVSNNKEMLALFEILKQLGYKIITSKECDNWVYTTEMGEIHTSNTPVVGYSYICESHWLVPEYIDIETINVNGKSYIKSEYEAALSRLKPV